MSSLISLELYVGMKTPLGWIIFLIKFKEDFISIWILKILRPQLDEPEQPPISIRKRKRRLVFDHNIGYTGSGKIIIKLK